MPQVFKIGSYWVFFWTNENEPLEPIHVHVCEGRPRQNTTKSGLQKVENAFCPITTPKFRKRL